MVNMQCLQTKKKKLKHIPARIGYVVQIILSVLPAAVIVSDGRQSGSLKVFLGGVIPKTAQ